MKQLQNKLRLRKMFFLLLWGIFGCIFQFSYLRSPILQLLNSESQFLYKCIMVIAILMAFKKVLWLDLKRFTRKMLLNSILVAIGILGINSSIVFFATGEVQLFSYASNPTFILFALLVAPLYEELIYRFLFLTLFETNQAEKVMLILSNLIFVYSHHFIISGNLIAFIEILILSLSLSGIFFGKRNIYSSLIVHVGYNLGVLILNFFVL